MSSSRRQFIQTMGTGAAGLTLGSAALTSCTSSGKKLPGQDAGGDTVDGA